jgi:hypothetical protein
VIVPERARQIQSVAEECVPPDLYILQQADYACREGVEVLLSELPSGLRVEVREVQEVLQEVQVH